MNCKQLYFIVIILICGCISCKKYPEDHKISLQTAKKRLRAHEWHFCKLYINQTDSTMTHLKNILPNSNTPADISFKITEGIDCTHDDGKIELPFHAKSTGATPYYRSSISLDKKKKNLNMYPVFMNNYQKPLIPSTMNSIFWIPYVTKWEITKLTKTDLHFKSTYNNYEVKFEFVN